MSNPYASPPPDEPEKDAPANAPVPPSDAPRGPYGQSPSPEPGAWQAPPDASGQPYGQPYGQQPGYDASQRPDGQAAWSAQQPYGQPDPYGQQGPQQWAGPPTGYGTVPGPGQGYGYPLVDRLRTNSTWVLVLGILGVIQVLGLLGAIPAWIWGNSLIRQAREVGLPDDVVQNAKIGRILGIVEVALTIAVVVIGLIFLIVGAAAFNQSY